MRVPSLVVALCDRRSRPVALAALARDDREVLAGVYADAILEDAAAPHWPATNRVIVHVHGVAELEAVKLRAWEIANERLDGVIPFPRGGRRG